MKKIKSMKKAIILVLVIATLLVLGKNIFFTKQANKEIATNQRSEAVARNVILYIGDGMGPSSIGLLMQYARYAQGSKYSGKRSVLEIFINNSEQGLMLTNIYDGIVADSPSSITQIVGGEMSVGGYVGMNYKKQKVKTVFKMAQENGLAVGIVADSELIDGTPSGLVAHNLDRYDKPAIAEDMINSNVDVMLSGGLKYFDKKLLKRAKKNGYEIVNDKISLKQSKSNKILGLFTKEYMPFAIDKYKRENLYVPDLSSMTLKALDVLSKDDDGFFLMVEAAKIDWALHWQDAGAVMHEMLNFDENLAFLYKYAYKNPDTLLIVMADHDTAGFGFEYNKNMSAKEVIAMDGKKIKMGNVNFASYENLDRLFRQKTTFDNFKKEFESFPQEQQDLANFTALFNNVFAVFLSKSDLAQAFVTKDYAQLKQILDKERNIVWASTNHLSTPINVFAFGPGSELFRGVYHSTEIAGKIEKVLGL